MEDTEIYDDVETVRGILTKYAVARKYSGNECVRLANCYCITKDAKGRHYLSIDALCDAMWALPGSPARGVSREQSV